MELVVLRGIAQSSELSGALYDWASEVVAKACSDRCNVWVCSVLFIYLFKFPSPHQFDSHSMKVQWCNLGGMQVHDMPKYGDWQKVSIGR